MTTIAARAGVLVADTQMTYADSPTSVPKLKLFIAGDYAVGVCGSCDKIPTIRQWFEQLYCTPESMPERLWEDSYDILAMNADGGIFTLFGDTLHELPVNYFALGSGRLVAMGAMAAGSNAVEAVKIACKYDVYTGGPVEFLTVEDIRAAIAKRNDFQ